VICSILPTHLFAVTISLFHERADAPPVHLRSRSAGAAAAPLLHLRGDINIFRRKLAAILVGSASNENTEIPTYTK
uniref:Uncharacterized protein n=1 Tax=Oryza punctata TaxID=4537 RepID=A0A0E0M6D0_ORYPU